MFYQLKNSLVAALLLALALGCKREVLMDKSTHALANDATANKVQQWLKAQPPQQVGVRKAHTALPKLTLQWEAIGFDAATNTHWVPAVMGNGQQGKSFAKAYLMATKNGEGQITGGQYIMVLPNAQKMGKGAAAVVAHTPAALLATDKPRDFSGALLYYDTQGLFTGSEVYEAGQLLPQSTANLAARDGAEGDPDPNYVIQECGGATGTSPCIEWFWQTYVNGVLVSEDYINTTCCGGTSGGGSGTDCQAQLDAMVAAGEVVTNSPITETTESITNAEWKKRYSWVIFTAANTWSLISYERAVLEKVYYPTSNQSLWEYKTFEHSGIAEAGFVAGGSRSFKDLGATINKTKYTAYVQVDFSVTASSMTCNVTNVYNGNKRFVAPNTITFVANRKR